MTAPRPPGFSLAQAVQSASFTPRRSDLEPLLDLLGERDVAGAVERAVCRLGTEAIPAVRQRLQEAKPPLKPRLARLLGRLGRGDADVMGDLVELLADADPKTRRNAALALGKQPVPARTADDAKVEGALIAAWNRETHPDVRRSIEEALGKVGGPAALDLLSRPELATVAGRAKTTLSRSLSRATPSRVDPDRAPSEPVPIILHCRSGLAPILADELPAGFHARAGGADRVSATLSGKLAEVFRARTMLWFGFPLPPESGDTGDAIVRALSSEAARRVFETWTEGPIRYRIRWASGGHRRALVWATAESVARACPSLVNDPTASTWEAVVETDGEVRIELVPKRLADPRFAYRSGDVPASSHPTIAAALARIAGARPDDVVWDPFVGSGLELVERALLGPWRAIVGTDRDPKAIEVARRNLAAARVRGAELRVANATEHLVPGVTLILTNPPMGRRVDRGDVGPLLDRFLDHAAASLEPGGRLVWVSPLPRRTSARARRAGLVLTSSRDIDMGGFTAQIQAFRKATRR